MLGRLKAALPTGWFADETPVLDGILSGLSQAWSWVYGFLQYVRSQTRILTATDSWLDIIALDFFGARVARAVGQSDSAFRARIIRELQREKGTRAALMTTLSDLTGRSPVIFEPMRPADTGAYGQSASLAYGVCGGWGSIELPFQTFVTAFRPTGSGVALVIGWGNGAGGYGAGQVQYSSMDMVQGQVSDAEINAAIADVLPIATIAWTRISN